MAIRALSPTLWLATAALAAAGCEATTDQTGTTTTAAKVPQIITLSNRADMISGGDALVEIVLPDGGSPQQLHVTLGDKDVSSQFAPLPPRTASTRSRPSSPANASGCASRLHCPAASAPAGASSSAC